MANSLKLWALPPQTRTETPPTIGSSKKRRDDKRCESVMLHRQKSISAWQMKHCSHWKQATKISWGTYSFLEGEGHDSLVLTILLITNTSAIRALEDSNTKKHSFSTSAWTPLISILSFISMIFGLQDWLEWNDSYIKELPGPSM